MRVWAPVRRRGKRQRRRTPPHMCSPVRRAFPEGTGQFHAKECNLLRDTILWASFFLLLQRAESSGRQRRAQRCTTEEGARLFYRASGIRFRHRKATFANRPVNPNFCRMHLALCELYLINQSRERVGMSSILRRTAL